MKLDLKRCIGCRMGISLMEKESYGYTHVDFFGKDHHCKNSENISNFMLPSQSRSGFYLPGPELRSLFETREKWGDDIQSICSQIFKDEQEKDDFMTAWHEMEDSEIEAALIRMAIDASIEVDEKSYPDLIFWK